METELERLVVRLMGDGTQYQKMLQEAQGATQKLVTAVKGAAGNMSSMSFGMRNFAREALGALGPIGVAMTGIGLAAQSISLAAQAEQMEIAFGVMLKSGEAGKQMVKDLQTLAAATPLEMPSLQAATKTLLQFGVEGSRIIPTLRMLGDTVMGDATKLQQISLAFGQMSSTGRLMGQDLLQMINAGFNPLQEIARTTGRSVVSLKGDMEKGRISVDMVREAFRTATAEGGNFFQGMEKGSKGLIGLFSTMKDDIGAVMRTLGEEITSSLNLKEVVKTVSAGAQAVTDAFKSLPPDVKAVISTVVGLTGAVLAMNVAWMLIGPVITGTIGSAVVVVTGFIKVLGALKAAALAANAAMSTNMIGWAAVGTFVVAIAAGIAYLGYTLGTVLADAFYGAGAAATAFNNEIQRSGQLHGELVGRFQKGTKNILAEADRLTGPAKQTFLEKQVEAAEKELTGLGAGVQRAQGQVEEWDSAWGRATGNKMLELTRKSLEEANVRLEEGRKRAEELREALKKATEPARDPALLKALSDLTAKEDIRASTLRLSADEAELVKKGLDKLPPAMLRKVRTMQESNRVTEEALKADKELEKGVKELMDSLQEEIETSGMSAEAKKLHKFESMGLTDAQRREAQARIALAKAANDHTEEMKKGKELTKELLTPTEVYSDRLKELQKWLQGGAINQQTFTRATADAKKKLHDAAAGAAHASQELQKLDAVLAGGSESYTRLVEYQERVLGAGKTGADVQTMREGLGVPLATTSPLVAQPVPSGAAAGASDQQSVQLLKQAVDYLSTIAGKPLITLAGANLR